MMLLWSNTSYIASDIFVGKTAGGKCELIISAAGFHVYYFTVSIRNFRYGLFF